MTEPVTGPDAVIVLAAGAGTRMKSSLPKVLHRIAGKPLLAHVLTATADLSPARCLVVVGHGHEEVRVALAEAEEVRAGFGVQPKAVQQKEQRGTGDATRVALAAVPDLQSGVAVVLPGDAPLVTTQTLRSLVERHRETRAAVTALTAVVDDPTGYGRIVRDADGHPAAIVEERDADEATRAVTEIGTSIYAFDIEFLRAALSRLTTDNKAGEEYLTDVVGLAAADQQVLAALVVPDAAEVMGVNDRAQLATAGRALRDRIVAGWMAAGVSVLDPATTWIDSEVTLEPDVTLQPGVQLLGHTAVAAGAVVGPDTTLIDTSVGSEAHVVRAHCVRAEIGSKVSVGPFAYLRPGARLRAGSKIGTFVEVKNADVGEDSRVPHLTYVGDATIGVGSNIGASSVFVNYDGVTKHRSVIGDHVRTGSDNTFVAPVSVGDGAYTGAGSVIRDDVPPGALAVSAGPQRNIDGWVARRRAGTAADEAARRARSGSESGGDGEESEPANQPSADQGAAQ